MPTVNIRHGRDADATLLTALYRRAVEVLGARDYNPAQIRAWADLAPSPERLRALCQDGRTRLVAAAADDSPLAFADLEPDGHIHFFYCTPEAAGTGAATCLYEALEEAARAQGITRLYAEASESARRFFMKQGFSVSGRRDFEVAGIPIHNYAVAKELGGRPQATMPTARM